MPERESEWLCCMEVVSCFVGHHLLECMLGHGSVRFLNILSDASKKVELINSELLASEGSLSLKTVSGL